MQGPFGQFSTENSRTLLGSFSFSYISIEMFRFSILSTKVTRPSLLALLQWDHSRPHSPFAPLSRQGLGTRIEGLWRHRILLSQILGLPVFMYEVVMSLHTLWDCQWRPSSEDSRNVCGLCVNLENVSLRVGQKEV